MIRIPALSLRHLPQLALWGFFFLVLIYLPLRGVELWGHVTWGEWILEQRSLPAEDPVLPLAEGMPVVDTAWLSQVILAATERAGGAEWLSRLFAATVLVTYLLLARAYRRRSGSGLAATLGVLAALALTWSRATTLGPGSFGALCFAALFALLATGGEEVKEGGGGARPLSLWIGVPLLFALWANLDASFVFGLAVLACRLAGRAIDAGWRERGLRGMLDDRALRFRLYLLELAAAVTLLNPYGLDLLLYALRLSPVAPSAEPQPLVLTGLAGLSFALSAVVLLFALRHGRRRMPAADVLLLALFAGAVVGGAGRLAWYGPVFSWVLAPQLADLTARWAARRAARPRRTSPEEEDDDVSLVQVAPGPNWRYTVMGAMLVAVIFVFSPLSSSLVGRAPRTSGQLLGAEAPLGLTAYLTANPPAGPVFNPAHWGGWLALEGPPGLQLFVTPEAKMIPRRVLQDYGRVVSAAAEWPRILERYRIDTVILDRNQQATLAALMRSVTDWRQVYEDPGSAVYVRVAERHEHAAGEAGESIAALGPEVPEP